MNERQERVRAGREERQRDDVLGKPQSRPKSTTASLEVRSTRSSIKSLPDATSSAYVGADRQQNSCEKAGERGKRSYRR